VEGRHHRWAPGRPGAQCCWSRSFRRRLIAGGVGPPHRLAQAIPLAAALVRSASRRRRHGLHRGEWQLGLRHGGPVAVSGGRRGGGGAPPGDGAIAAGELHRVRQAGLEQQDGGAVLEHLEVHARVIQAAVLLLADAEVGRQSGHLEVAGAAAELGGQHVERVDHAGRLRGGAADIGEGLPEARAVEALDVVAGPHAACVRQQVSCVKGKLISEAHVVDSAI
jgi:hypothetical protein